ncbi:MAG: 3-keto-disaccharide hydrolase [Bryobacteraceae bacterium]
MSAKLIIFSMLCLLARAQPDGDAQPRVVDPGDAAKPPADAIVLFGGSDLSGWTVDDGLPARCPVSDGAMACRSGDGNMLSKVTFRDAQIHLEFMVPLMPDQKDQLRGNSGVYIQARYEIQILDSYQNPTHPTGACGALYGQSPPLVNASRPPEQWQTYDIVFHAPRCASDGGFKTRGAVTVLHNGVLVQDHVVIQKGDNCAAEGLDQAGPLMLQDHSGFPEAPFTTMKFRNIWIRKLDESAAFKPTASGLGRQ